MSVYKRLLFLVSVLTILLLTLLPGSALAKTGQVRTTNCSNQCVDLLTWPGTTYGVFSSFTVSSPAFSNQGSQWARVIDLSAGANWTQPPRIKFGVVKNAPGYNDICGPGLWYFAVLDTNIETNLKCLAIPGGAINNTSHFQYNNYTSGGGGNLIQITDSFGSHLTDFIPYTAGAVMHYANINLIELVIDGSITGHYVWGSEWDNNQWATGDGVFHLITANGSALPYGPVPPQMFWHTLPSSSPGGVLYSCVYDSTVNTCTLGS